MLIIPMQKPAHVFAFDHGGKMKICVGNYIFFLARSNYLVHGHILNWVY